MAVGERRRDPHAQVSGRCQDSLVRAGALGWCESRCQDEKVLVRRVQSLADGRHLGWHLLRQSPKVVEYAQPLLRCELPELLALPSRQLAHSRSPDGDKGTLHGQVVRFQQVRDHVHRRKARVRLVRAVAAHRLRVRQARQRQARRDPAGLLADSRHQPLDHCEDAVFPNEGHLDIDLGELRLPVRPEVLVAEAANDLEVAVVAADDEQLLEELRGLGQGVHRARLDPARYEKVARALRCRARHERRLDLEKALRMKAISDHAVDLIPQRNVALHLDPSQIDVAELQPGLLAHRRMPLFVNLKRGGLGRIEHPETMGYDFDGSRLEAGVVGVLRAAHDRAFHGNHVFAPEGFGPSVRFRVRLGVEDDLGDTGSVSEVQEQQASQVALAMDPAHQQGVPPDVEVPDYAAIVGSAQVIQGIECRGRWALFGHQLSSRYRPASST